MTADASSPRPVVVIVPTGSANLASVRAGLLRAGAEPKMLERPDEIETADHLVLPGVGALGPAMQRLNAEGWREPLRARVRSGGNTLAVCLGLQLLFEDSAEAPTEPALGLLDGHVGRFEPGLRVPHMGWNRVLAPAGDPVLATGEAYFANSYRVRTAPLRAPRCRIAWADHGGPFVAAVAREGLLACQFHPELSGEYGLALVRRWLGRPDSASSSDSSPAGDALMPRLIPCLDLKDGRVVKGVRFQGLRDAGDPTALAAAYADQGADEIVLLDVSATVEGRGHAVRVVEAVRRAVGVPLTVGGGIRSVSDAGRLLDAGADKVSVNTAAVDHPDLLTALAERFGRQCVVIAIDAQRRSEPEAVGWSVVVRAGRETTKLDAASWAKTATDRGAGEILLTSWDRDGTGEGYDLDLIRTVRTAVDVPIIASGGAAHPGHLGAALDAGADAVLAASIFHDGRMTVRDVKTDLQNQGIVMRGAR